MRTAYAALAAALCMAAACGEKPKDTTYIVRKPAKKEHRGVQKTGDYRQSVDVDWLGGKYRVEMERTAADSLGTVDDGTGNKYRNNTVKVSVRRGDGSLFFSRTFTKESFSDIVGVEYLRRSVLLGVVFDKAEGDCLHFAGSVGSPDKLSDEFIPIAVKLSGKGVLSTAKAKSIDTAAEE